MTAARGRSGGDRHSTHFDASPTDGGPSRPLSEPNEVIRKWDALVAEIPDGVLRRADSHELLGLARTLHMADVLYQRILDDPTDLPTMRLFNQTAAQIHRWSVCFGLNPADRGRLKVEATSEDDPMAAILERFQRS